MHPTRFREELKKFDRQLDFEFNSKKSRWEIVGVDRKNKHYLIKSFPLGKINTIGLHTLQELYDVSPLKQGGAKAVNARIDQMIEDEEKAEDKKRKDQIDERLEDAYMHLQHREGTRISFSTQAASGEPDGFVLTDKRRVHDSLSGE